MKLPSLSLPFLNGVYVAIDAIKKAFLIVDGPYCVFTKAEMQYCHNLHCGLIPPLGRSRIVHTAQKVLHEEVTDLSTDRTASVDGIFAEVCRHRAAEIVLTTSFDFHELTNFPLKEIARKNAERFKKPVFHIPSASLGGGWLDGYSRTCTAIAKGLALSARKSKKNKVAVVGYLFDRDEPDHVGNIKELKRLLKALGMETASIWLSGKRISHLKEVETASLIVSLPYAREAARILGKRLRVPVVETGLPLGLTGTERFLTALGAKLGRRVSTERFIRREVSAAIRDTRVHVLRVIRGRAAHIRIDDPHLGAALTGLCRDLGITVHDESSAPVPSSPADRASLLFSPSTEKMKGVIHTPFGYPNYNYHPVTESPFLGFTGFRHLVDRITMDILRSESPGDDSSDLEAVKEARS